MVTRYSKPAYTVVIAAVFALVAVVVWHFSTVRGSAQSPGSFNSAVFTVTPDAAHGTATLNLPSSPGPFSQLGIIASANGGGGVFRRMGTKFADGSTLVVDQYDLTSFNGSMTASGSLSDVAVGDQTQLLGLTGAIGTFRFNTGGVVAITVVDPASGAFTARIRPTNFGLSDRQQSGVRSPVE